MTAVFIGGTGLCGSNILKEVLSKHSKAVSLPFEHRIFLDPDGIVDFLCTFPTSWSPYLADVRLRRLGQFLTDLGKKSEKGRYADWELAAHIPGFESLCEELMQSLVEFEYKGSWEGWFNGALEGVLKEPTFLYHSPMDRGELVKVLGTFVQGIIKAVLSKKSGASCYIDDGTWSILMAGELQALLPESKIIHVYQEPLDVVSACVNDKFVRKQVYKGQWKPDQWEKAVDWYVGIMSYWLDSIKPCFPQENLLEVSLADLVYETKKTLKWVCKFLELDWEESLLAVQLSPEKARFGRGEKEIPYSYRQLIYGKLLRFTKEFGTGFTEEGL